MTEQKNANYSSDFHVIRIYSTLKLFSLQKFCDWLQRNEKQETQKMIDMRQEETSAQLRSQG